MGAQRKNQDKMISIRGDMRHRPLGDDVYIESRGISRGNLGTVQGSVFHRKEPTRAKIRRARHIFIHQN